MLSWLHGLALQLHPYMARPQLLIWHTRLSSTNTERLNKEAGKYGCAKQNTHKIHSWFPFITLPFYFRTSHENLVAHANSLYEISLRSDGREGYAYLFRCSNCNFLDIKRWLTGWLLNLRITIEIHKEKVACTRRHNKEAYDSTKPFLALLAMVEKRAFEARHLLNLGVGNLVRSLMVGLGTNAWKSRNVYVLWIIMFIQVYLWVEIRNLKVDQSGAGH